ncbi:hypothetical protein J4476_02255 [Candidatus Woesearchaeota archaeon]|nr:MAG: hypothetical protein QT09_C0007G0041 [archaeon GW2011_AR18]MBS3161494.1 hypothetical protein [Candidatus Woesearchaeota archaeon]HIH25461.1 hypothetical protein [Nanoarchaeota archaeon]
MGKRKKSIFYYIGQIFVLLYRLIEYIVKAVYYLLKGIVTGIGWIFTKIFDRDKNKTIIEDKIIVDEKPILKDETKPIKKTDVKHGSISSKPMHENFKEIKTIKGDYQEFENKILDSSSTIGIILGARGTGKSALGMKLLENLKAETGKEVYAMGFNSKDMPNWINIVDSIDDAENNSILLVDESGIQFSSRESMSNSNKLLSQILFIARHKDLSIIFISQNSSNIEINTIRQADYIALKPSSLLQKDFERKKIKEIYEEVEKEFEKYKEDKGLTYIYSHNYKGFVSNPLPSFWNIKVSKAYNKFKK